MHAFSAGQGPEQAGIELGEKERLILTQKRKDSVWKTESVQKPSGLTKVVAHRSGLRTGRPNSRQAEDIDFAGECDQRHVKDHKAAQRIQYVRKEWQY